MCLCISGPKKKQDIKVPNSATQKGNDYPNVTGDKITNYSFERHYQQIKYFQLHSDQQMSGQRGTLEITAAAKYRRWHEVRDEGKGKVI